MTVGYVMWQLQDKRINSLMLFKSAVNSDMFLARLSFTLTFLYLREMFSIISNGICQVFPVVNASFCFLFRVLSLSIFLTLFLSSSSCKGMCEMVFIFIKEKGKSFSTTT